MPYSSYLDRYRSLTTRELCDEAQALFDKVKLAPQGTVGLIELRNVVPFLIERLRDADEFVEMPRLGE